MSGHLIRWLSSEALALCCFDKSWNFFRNSRSKCSQRAGTLSCMGSKAWSRSPSALVQPVMWSPKSFVEGCSEPFFQFGACLGDHGGWMILFGVPFGPGRGRCWEVLLSDGGAVSNLIVEGLLVGVVDRLFRSGFFPFVGLRGRSAGWFIAVVGVEPRDLFS